MCDLRTSSGAFLLTRLLSSSTLRRFLRSTVLVVCSKEISSVSGIEVSHSPIKLSQEAVRRCEPVGFEAMEERGEVCRCRVARGSDEYLRVGEESSTVTSVSFPVRSWEALAIRNLS